MSIYVHGLDLGQAQDFSALVIIEVLGTDARLPYTSDCMGYPKPEFLPVEIPPILRFNFRHIERFPLGTKYQRICEIVADRMLHTPRPKYLAVDQTGVGRPVLEMLGPLNPIGITITGGQEVTPGDWPNTWKVPKRDLVTALQVPAQQRTLRFAPKLEHAELLAKEMLNFRAKISTSGHDTYEAWREADHDDLVLAAAIGCWTAEQVLRLRLQQAVEAIQQASQKMAEISPI